MKKHKFYKGRFMIALVETDLVSHIRILADNVPELAEKLGRDAAVVYSALSHGHTHMKYGDQILKVEFIPVRNSKNTQGGEENE